MTERGIAPVRAFECADKNVMDWAVLASITASRGPLSFLPSCWRRTDPSGRISTASMVNVLCE